MAPPENVMRVMCREHRKAEKDGERGDVIARYADRFGVHRTTVHGWIKKREGKSMEVDRAHQRSVPTELVDWVARRKIEGARQALDAREVATKRCLDEAVRQGIPGAGDVSVSYMNSLLREAGFRVSEYRTLVEADYANQVWQADFSRSKYMQVRDRLEDGDYLLEKSGRHLHYKESGKLKNLWLVAAKDHHSRVPISRGYVRRGETAMLGLDFFDWVFNRPASGPVCLRGRPYDLKTDNGAFAKAEIVRYTFEEVYEIALPTSTPYNSASQGLIERNWRSVWAEFELPLVMTKPGGWTIRLSDYNALLHQFCAEKARQEHPTVKGRSREEVYATSCLRKPPRDVPRGSIMRHACHVDERTVDGYHRVRIENDFYDVPKKIDGEWTVQHETKLRVFRSLDGRVVAKLKGCEHKPVELGTWEPGRYGDFAAGSAAQKGQTYREEQDRISEEEEAARPAQAESRERSAASPKGAVAEADAPDEPEKLTLNAARERLGNALFELALPEGDRHQWLAYLQAQGELRAGMTRGEVDALADDVREAVREERAERQNERNRHSSPEEGGSAVPGEDPGTLDTDGTGPAKVARAA